MYPYVFSLLSIKTYIIYEIKIINLFFILNYYILCISEKCCLTYIYIYIYFTNFPPLQTLLLLNISFKKKNVFFCFFSNKVFIYSFPAK